MWLLGHSFSANALTIIPTFDFSITSNPNASAVIADVQTAINFYQSTFTAPVTVQMSFSEGGGPSGYGVGASSAARFFILPITTRFTNLLLLAADATSVIGQIASSNLPSLPAWYVDLIIQAQLGRAMGLNTPPIQHS